jgi:hypothetical protein
MADREKESEATPKPQEPDEEKLTLKKDTLQDLDDPDADKVKGGMPFPNIVSKICV